MYTRCSRCPGEDRRCKTCDNTLDGEVFLLSELTDTELKRILGKMEIVNVPCFTNALNYIGIPAEFEIFNERRIRYLETKYEVHIFLYKENEENYTIGLREPRKKKFEKILRLMLTEDLPESSYGLIENFGIIQSKKRLPKLYICKQLKNCKYSTTHKGHFMEHEEICKNYNTQKIQCLQVAYGSEDYALQEMVSENIVPEEALTYRNRFLATFDLETLETKISKCNPARGMVSEANLKLLSIAVGSNMPGYIPKCWVRKSSDPSEEARLVKNFVDELHKLWEEKQKNLPNWIESAYDKLSLMYFKLKERNAKWTEYQNIWRFKRVLKKFTVLDCFGFNSGRFDIPCIAASLLAELKKTSSKISILKKMSSYFTISTERLIFKDVLRYTAPCSYDKFVKVWEAPTTKSIWPYSYYGSVEEMKADKKFPPLEVFKSELKGGQKPDMPTYIAAKTEFFRRKLLPKGHPDRIVSMYGFLKYYNLQDVQPLAIAIENCFECYHKYFGVNAMTAMSLPSMAQTAMFSNYKSDAPYIYSFPDENQGINKLFRDNVLGGLVNVYRRHVCTYDREGVPEAARYSDNGDPFSSIVSLDFTSMYLTCQNDYMPTSPGILWTLKNKKYTKNIMCAGHSFKAQQWLCYRQETGTYSKMRRPKKLIFR